MKKKTKKTSRKSPLVIIVGLVLVLSFVQLLISHRLAAYGRVVRELEDKAGQLEKENKQLEEEIGQIGSLINISQRAEKLGLIKVDHVLQLTPQVPVAYHSDL
ncbi:hypothetical protein ACFL0Y_04005 [Patescibacteria group bacterium]